MLNWEDPRCFNEGEGQIGEQCSFRGHVKGVARGHLLSFLSHKAQFFFLLMQIILDRALLLFLKMMPK